MQSTILCYNKEWHAGFFDVSIILRHYWSGPEVRLGLVFVFRLSRNVHHCQCGWERHKRMMLYKLLDIEHSRKVYELYIIFQGKMRVYYLCSTNCYVQGFFSSDTKKKIVWDMISFYELLKWTWCWNCGHKFRYFCSKLNKGGLRAPQVLVLFGQTYFESFIKDTYSSCQDEWCLWSGLICCCCSLHMCILSGGLHVLVHSLSRYS